MVRVSNHLAMRGCGLALILLVTACGGGSPAPADNGIVDNGIVQPEAEAIATPGPVATAAVEPELPAAAPSAAASPQTPALQISDADIEAQYSPELDTCLNSGDAAKGVTPAMAACIQAELARQDDRLNGAYQSAMDKRGPAEQAQLRIEERAWIKRRDATCEARATGGTIDRIEIPSCLLKETVRRRIVLQPMAG